MAKHVAWVILSKKGKLVGSKVYNTRIRAYQETTKDSQTVVRVSIVGGVVRKKKGDGN